MIRAYLLNSMKEKGRVERVSARLRGPRDEFKDFAGFLILQVKNEDAEFRVLAETGIYENLRIVATDSEELAQQSPENVIRAFTNALEEPETNNALLILSTDSKVG